MISERNIKGLFGFSSTALSSPRCHYGVSVQSEQRQQRRKGGGQRNGEKTTPIQQVTCCTSLHRDAAEDAPLAKAAGSEVAYGHHVPPDMEVQVQDCWEVKRHLPKQEMLVWKQWNCLVQQLFAKRIYSAHTKVAAAVVVFENADGKQSGLFSKTLPRGVFIAVLCVLETTLSGDL